MTGHEIRHVLAAPQPTMRRAGTARGERLPATLSSEMSARFGMSFGDVRVRRDADAAHQAKERGLQAFAHGDEIAFAAGRYQPTSSAGRMLIAHELAHVAQQRRGGSGDDTEGRANRAAEQVIGGRDVDSAALGGAPIGIHGQPEEKPAPDASAKVDEQEPKSKEKGEGAGHTFAFAKTLDSFALDRADLTPQHLEAIDELALGISIHLGLLMRGKARIEITGHTDSAGTEKHNAKLGEDRATRVKLTLERKLASEKNVAAVDWSTRSAGESELLVPTSDNTHEARNRRVQVHVTIISLPDPKKPDPIQIIPTDPIIPDTPIGPPRAPGDDMWKRMEENQRKIEEYNRKHPKKSQSAQDVVVDALMNSLIDPLIDKLPVSKSLREKAREGVRKGLNSATEAACEAAIDATGVTGDQAAGVKAACKAAIKMKQGEQGSGGSR